MSGRACPGGLSAGGRKLWRAVVGEHDLDPGQLVVLLEACRAKDRLDRLDLLLRGDAASWRSLVADVDVVAIDVSALLDGALRTAKLLAQLLAALRLPDPSTGRRPQYRGARGVQLPSRPRTWWMGPRR